MTIIYYLVNILLVSSIGYLLWQKEPPTPLKKYFIPALALKLTAGILLGIFYKVYFGGGDSQLFQTQSDYVTEFARVSPASYLRLLLTRKYESETLRTTMVYYYYSNSYFMVMLLSILNFITGSHILLNSLYFSLFSFWGSWQLGKIIYHLYPHLLSPIVISFLFFPSVVFWSSGVSKEAIYLGSLFLFIAQSIRLIKGLSVSIWSDSLALVLSAYLLWKIKFYFAALVFALILSYALVNYLTKKIKLLKYSFYRFLLFGSGLLIGGYFISKGNEVLKLDYFVTELIKSNQVLTQRSAGKPFIEYSELEPNLVSIFKNSPAAVFHTLLRPFIWEGKGLFYFLAGLENLLILTLLLFTFYQVLRQSIFRPSLEVVVMVIYIFTIATLIGLSTPNIGSLNRYRTAFLPFVVFLLLSFNHHAVTFIRRKCRSVCMAVYNKIPLSKN